MQLRGVTRFDAERSLPCQVLTPNGVHLLQSSNAAVMDDVEQGYLQMRDPGRLARPACWVRTQVANMGQGGHARTLPSLHIAA